MVANQSKKGPSMPSMIMASYPTSKIFPPLESISWFSVSAEMFHVAMIVSNGHTEKGGSGYRLAEPSTVKQCCPEQASR